jgi:hypothetical protein
MTGGQDIEMTNRVKLVAPALVLLAGLAFNGPATAKVEYTKAEKTACVTCHVTAKSKELNDVGKCYEKSKDVAACKEKSQK